MKPNPQDRRKLKRIRMKQPAFITGARSFGQIFDISLEGLSFTHEGPEEWPRKTSEIAFLFNERVQLTRLPVTVVYDRAEQPATDEGGSPLRRCGVRFGKLQLHQLYKLEYLIWSQTEGWSDLPSSEELLRSPRPLS